MVDYVSLGEQVDADFVRARRKAVLRRLLGRLRGVSAPGRLPCFEEVRKKLGAAGGVRLGRRAVRAADVVGSTGRCAEFDGSFLPASGRARTRWERVDRAFRSGEELPPITLYKVGDSYFVEDGNHRVSVARYHGVEWIDAVVTEFRARPPRTGGGAGTPAVRPGVGTRGGAEGERAEPSRRPGPSHGHTG